MPTGEYSRNVEPARLSPAAEENLVQRLYYRQMDLAAQKETERQQTLDRALAQKNVTITKGQEDNLVSRIYDQQLQRFAASKAERDRKVEEEVHRNDKKMDGDEIGNQVQRMYDEELKRSKMRRAALQERYLPTQEPKKINKKDLQDCVERLYHVDYEKRDEELFKKYVYPYDPKSTVISRADEQEMANRLCTTKGTS